MVHDPDVVDFSSAIFRSRWVIPDHDQDYDVSSGKALLPETVGSAEYHVDLPKSGLEIYSFKAHFRSNLDMVCEAIDERPYLWIAMNFTGNCAYSQSPTIQGETEDNHGYLALLKAPPIRLGYVSGVYHGAGISVSPERLGEILRDQIDDRRISKFTEGTFQSEIIRFGTTESMRRIADQIHYNPYGGRMKDVYLEGKALEILTEAFDSALDGRKKEENLGSRRRAFEAREIMMRDLHAPPFIADVAKKVGVSQKKLIDIFREVFGATPLQCLVRWRLERARAILQEGNVSVKQVSYMVGYNYESNFSNAFTRYFGFPPSNLIRPCDR